MKCEEKTFDGFGHTIPMRPCDHWDECGCTLTAVGVLVLIGGSNIGWWQRICLGWFEYVVWFCRLWLSGCGEVEGLDELGPVMRRTLVGSVNRLTVGYSFVCGMLLEGIRKFGCKEKVRKGERCDI
ncbi:hypothetical protein Tco_1541038 [Tanacetum coccineum]